MRFREFRPVRESTLGQKSMTKGSVAFKKSDVSDAQIKQVVQKVAAETGVSEQDLMKQISDEIDTIKEIGQYSSILYDTMLQNAAASGAFKIIETSKFPVKKQEYDMTLPKNERLFLYLLKLIKADNPSYFPLKSPDKLRVINDIQPIFVPSTKDEYKHYNKIVKTAAMSSSGDFIFNTDFIESLLYYGAAIDVKPKGKKYVCNGGDVPDNWCYIEFLIMHEILHWDYGDFFSMERFDQYSQDVHNIGTDFRSNYILVKNGYEQLPMGLFSDDINLDRPETSSYQKIMALVDRELKKLPKRLRAVVKPHDDHPPPPKPPQPPKPPPPPPKPWVPKVGDIILHQDIHGNGMLVKVEKVYNDTDYEVRVLTKQEKEDFENEIGGEVKIV